MKVRVILKFAAFAILYFAGVAVSEFEISRSTIDGGGEMRSTGGEFELSGTIGQPDAGVLAGGSFTLTGGFWFAIPPGDVNEDGGTGLSDVSFLADCMGGPGGEPAKGRCRSFDGDGSGHVDLFDFSMIQSLFGGQ